MSDTMFYGVLRMPYEMAMGNELSRQQFYSRAQDAADRVESAEKRITELESRPAADSIEVDIELPDGDKREIKIGWREVRDGKLCLCVYIVEDAPTAPVVAEGRKVTYVPKRGKKGVMTITVWGPVDMMIPDYTRIIDDVMLYTAHPVAGSPADTCAEMRALCSACGGTGDVTSLDGEWRGACDCEASRPAAAEPMPASEAQTDMAEVMAEVQQARDNWPPFNSAHEGFAVLSEEVDELWDHIKTNQKRRDLPAMRKEAKQVAAMALRFMGECCDETTGRK